MGPTRDLRILAALVVATTFLPLTTHAQDEGGGDVGAEELILDEGPELEVEPPEAPESDETEGRLEQSNPHPNDVIWQLGAGGSFNYGNARSAGVSVNTSLGLRDGPDVGVIEGLFLYSIGQPPLTCGAVQAEPANYPMGTVDFCTPTSGTPPMPMPMSTHARAPGFNDWTESIVNLTWRLRYDHFFDAFNAFYIGHRGRIDRFAGVRPRLSLHAGYNRVFFEEGRHLLAMDIGVDGTFDFFTDPIRAQNDAIVAIPGGSLPPLTSREWRFVPSVRLGVNYVNHLNPFLTYDTTLEVLWDVVNPSHFRFEWVNHLRSAIDDVFSIRLDVTARLDGLPPGQAQVWNEDPSIQTTTMFDLLTTLNLVGSFDLDGEPMYATSAPDLNEAHEEDAPPAAATEPDPTAPAATVGPTESNEPATATEPTAPRPSSDESSPPAQ